MRARLPAAVVGSFLLACGGSSSGPSTAATDGGATTSSDGSTVTITGSCPSLGTTYDFAWTYVSGGTQCMANTPLSATVDVALDAGPTVPTVGGVCQTTLSGCSYSQTCTDVDADAGTSATFVSMYSVDGSGTITGEMAETFGATLGGQVLTVTCTYSLMGTKVQ